MWVPRAALIFHIRNEASCLDPDSRREELHSLLPVFPVILSALRLSEK